jgi:molybdenum cofactor cytidylyltransferase
VLEVVAARLEAGDVGEDQAANVLADAVCGAGVEMTASFTGRSNLFATRPGLLLIDQDALDRINLVNEDLTIATLPPYSVVDTRQMIATVKIIPFGVARADLDACTAIARDGGPLIRIVPFTRKRVGFIQTQLPGGKDSILEKATRVLQGRLDVFDAAVVREIRCAHDEIALSAAIRELQADHVELILVAGASAIVDRRDVIPAAIEHTGGRVEHYGMPVDPGNLLLLGYHSDIPVVGLPGCAKSPKYNGFDIVLVRLMAGLPVSKRDIMLMGAGGLLKEIASRGAPRAENNEPEKAPARAPRIAALILAGGQSRRMGTQNKLLADVAGKPMVQWILEAVKASQIASVIVVTGHEHEKLEQTLAGSDIRFVYNPHYAEGISTSLRAGLAALPEDIDGVLVCLGDMPKVTTPQINKLIAAFDPIENRAIIVPTCDGKRGNPILWSTRFANEMREVAGDVGAKHLLGEHADVVCEVEMNDISVLLDIDSPEMLAQIS